SRSSCSSMSRRSPSASSSCLAPARHLAPARDPPPPPARYPLPPPARHPLPALALARSSPPARHRPRPPAPASCLLSTSCRSSLCLGFSFSSPLIVLVDGGGARGGGQILEVAGRSRDSGKVWRQREGLEWMWWIVSSTPCAINAVCHQSRVPSTPGVLN